MKIERIAVMNNGIISRQNEDTSINYLAAQRQLYNEAKKFDNLGILFSIFLPLCCAVLQSLFQNNIYLNSASYILSIVSMVISLLLNSYISHKKESAAQIQQHFDTYVYQMPWDNKLFGRKKDVTHEVAEKSKKLLKKSGEREKLVNWYTPVVGTVELKKGIAMCQKENWNWDVTLRKRFRLLSFIIIISLTSIIFAIGIIKDESVPTLLCRIAFVTPMFQWLFETVKQLNSDIKNLIELDDLSSPDNSLNMDCLQEIQNKIYIHRKSCFPIPNMIYEMFKNNDEDVAHRTALMNRYNNILF